VLLGYLNHRLTRSYTRGGTFVTAFYAVLDSITRQLTYSSAGHNPPRLVRNNQIIPLSEGGHGLPLGILDNQPYGQSTLTLQPGDLLLLYTDGITEAFAPPKGESQRQLFGVERLDNLLLNCHDPSAQSCIDRIRAAVTQFSENTLPTDDQTLIAIRCL